MKRSRHASSSEDSDNGSNSTCWSQHSKSQPRRGKGKKPSEVFRTDLITAMKVHDSHQLNPDEYYILADPWRQDWEKGVQVPVSPQSIPHPVARVLAEKGKEVMFTKPKKLIRISRSESLGYVDIRTLAEGMCRYDLDEEDVAWIQIINEEFTEMGIPVLDEITMERVIEEFECRCHDNMTHATETEEGLGIEYDEDVVCDVCQSPDGEDNNEMVFCDKCNICVHQACYGIQKVPKGSWLCRICALGILPKCQLCPKKGGAMKPTRSGTKWVHVSCALWIPEVSIGNPEKMEPITNVSHIPSNRWALICCVCKEKRGACIQCSAKNCRTAFHVTCGLSASLEMNTILTEDDEVKFKSYCPKHSGLQGSEARESGGEEEEEKEVGDGDKKGKRRGRVREEEDDVSSSSFAPPELPSSRGPTGEPEALSSRQQEEKRGGLRKLKLQALEEEFFQFVDVEEVARRLKLSQEAVDFMYQYWKLKRKANFNQPLLTPKKDEEESLARREQEVLLRRLQLFTHLRQDLERVRNLTYMVTRREKMKRSLWRVQEQIFHHQVRLLDHELLTGDASAKDLEKIFSLGWLSNQGSQSGSPWGHSSLKTKSGSSKHEKRKGLHRKHLPYSPHTQKDSSSKPLDTKDSEGAKLKESVTVEVSGYTRDQNMDDGQGYQGFHYSKGQKAEVREDANHVKLQKSENRAEPRREAPGPEHHKEEQDMRSRDEELALTRQKQESDNEDEEEKRRRKKRKNEPTDSTPIQTKIRLGLKPLERTVSIRLVDIRASDFDDYSINTGTASKSLMTPDPSTTITTKANKNHSAPDSIITTKPGKANVILEHCGSSTKPSGLLRKTQANTSSSSSSHSASNGHLKNWGKFRIPKRSERPPGVAKEKQEEGAIEPASLQQQQRKPFLRPLTNTPEPSYPRTRLRTGAENEAFTPSSDAKPSDGEVEHCLKRCHSHQLRGDPSITRRYGNNIIRTGVLAS